MEIGLVLGRAFDVEGSSPVWLQALIEALDQPNTQAPEAEDGCVFAQHAPDAGQGKIT
jgi:hypothetical protein